jgi:hypothetical protein
MEESAKFFDALTKAARRETAAFNYYYQASEKFPSDNTYARDVQVQADPDFEFRRFGGDSLVL